MVVFMATRSRHHTEVPTDGCISHVMTMPYNREATHLASQHGLNISTIRWEDNARTKDSIWGPCISDMTLNVEHRSMPLIRDTSNFVDETWDVEIENIPLVVGNESGSKLRTVTLKEYLGSFRSFLHTPSSWTGSRTSLLADRDKHVICSAQACFLPIPEQGDANFNVAIRNYESMPGYPAVLAIVASANGTSAQILDGSMQKLYHNKNGEKAPFVGQRLSDFREETGSSLPSGAPMTSSEKQQNMLLIIQVPLKQHHAYRYHKFSPAPAANVAYKSSDVVLESAAVDVEPAILKVGKSEGTHKEICNYDIERDPQFPVRVTMQYYKTTSNGAVNDAVMSEIASELRSARKWAVAESSLVTETSDRTTEHSVHHYPLWWNQFWTEHAPLFPQYKSSDEAAGVLFANKRFLGCQLADVREQALEILAQSEGGEEATIPASKVSIQPRLPSWNVL